MTASHEELRAWDRAHVWHPFTQMLDWMGDDPLIISGGEGNYLIDIEGNRYLDGVSSLWCNLLGHNHPHLNAAIKSQLDQIAHSTLLGLSNVPSTLLARKLAEITPEGLTRVFYSDSGSTATEIALKVAFQYWQLRGETQRVKFASLVEAYHGDTLGAVSVGYSELFHHFYRPLLTETVRLIPPHLFCFRDGLSMAEALKAAVDDARQKLSRNREELAALILEPLMQGAAGMWAQPVEYVQALRRLTRELGLLLICDEVATGFGRTGKMFACQHAQITPDLLCLAKGMTGGYLPLAATLTTEEVFSAFLAPYDEFKTFFHGHTYTGNPLGCAAALATLEVLEDEDVLSALQPRITFLEQQLGACIAPLRQVADIRRWGFMVGIELMRDPDRWIPYDAAQKIGVQVMMEARRQGVIIRPLGNVIVLMPPLSMTCDELEQLVRVVRISITRVTCPDS